jgi:hypothetical protein
VKGEAEFGPAFAEIERSAIQAVSDYESSRGWRVYTVSSNAVADRVKRMSFKCAPPKSKEPFLY